MRTPVEPIRHSDYLDGPAADGKASIDRIPSSGETGGRAIEGTDEWIPAPPVYPKIIRGFQALLEKLKEVPTDELRVAVIDYWVGMLFVERAAVEKRMTDQKGQR